MKKLLLLGAATIMSASATWADVLYVPDGEPLSGTASEVIAKMKEHQENGGLYFMQMHTKEVKKSGFVYASNTNQRDNYRWDLDGVIEVSPAGESGNSKVFQIDFVDGTNNFTIKSLHTNHYFSIQGNNGYGKHRIIGTADGTDSYNNRPLTIANYTVIDYPTESGPLHDDDPLKDMRYSFQMTNATVDNNGSTTAYLQGYGNVDNVANQTSCYLAYQGITMGKVAQVILFPAKQVETATITVKFPDWNGMTMTEQVEAIAGEDVTLFITQAANAHGGLTDMVITSDNGGDLIVSETNNSFTVTGNWNYDFEPNQVYRISLAPGDNPSALRYMLGTGEIQTKLDGEETLSRLIPERLWFFKAGEEPNTFSLHNLYDPKKGVHFSPNAQGSYNNAKAVYQEEVTYFNLVHSSVDNEFYLKINGTTDAYVNDYSNNNLFSIYHTNNPDRNCILRLYPLEARDMEALGLPTNTIPTVENISEAVTRYNAQNIPAALRRVNYWCGNLIGWQPGRFDNEDHTFAEKLAAAEALQARIDNGEEIDEKEVKAAVAAIDFHELKFNQIKPGMFYRFKNKKSGKYLSTDENDGKVNNKSLMKMLNANLATYDNTIIYVSGTENGSYTLVGYQNGLVLADFDGSQNDWTARLSTAAHAGHSYLIQHQHLGGCILHSSVNGGHRHLHGSGETVNVAGNESSDDYQWYVELVEELPVTFYNVFNADDNSDEGWTSVYSPVALEVPAEYTHTTAYTGEFDNTNYNGKPDINHILATPIKPNAEDKVIIPANQPVLLFYNGEVSVNENDYLNTIDDRANVVLLNLPIAFGYESTEPVKGNLNAKFEAFENPENSTILTLHASTNNNFRPIEEYKTTPYIPGFKVYIDEYPEVEGADEIKFPIYTVNPNTMVSLPDDTDNGYKITVDENDKSNITITVTTPDADYDVYYKQLTVKDQAAAAPMRRAASVDHTGYFQAVKDGNVHTMTVQDGNVEYYAYHVPSRLKGAVRTATVDTTGIDAIIADGESAKVYDLQGRKLAAPSKGVNIINGKKVIVK